MNDSTIKPQAKNAVKLAALQHIEKLLGNVVCALLSIPALLLPNAKKVDVTNVKKILVIKFFGIGSLIMAEPFFRKTRETFPNAKIHLMTLSSSKDIIKMIPNIDQTYMVQLGPNIFTAIAAFIGCLMRAACGRYDVLIDMEFYTRASSIVTFASLAPIRVGYHSRGVFRGNIHNRRVPFNVYWHVTRNFIGLLAPFGIDVPDAAQAPQLLIPEDSADRAREILSAIGINNNRYLIINVNAGELAFERRWLPERFGELTAQLCNKYNLTAIFTGSDAEIPYVEKVTNQVKKTGAPAHNMAGQIPLECFVELCRNAKLCITNDSGPMHLAVAADATVVAFFGPETPMLYGPIGENHMVFYSNLACSPCMSVEFGKQIDCWHLSPFCQEAISAEEALQRIEKQYAELLST